MDGRKKATEVNQTDYTFTVIGIVESCFKEKFGIPRQPGLAPSATAKIWMRPPYDDPGAFEGILQSSHLWIQFVFHKMVKQKHWTPKVRPPRLGGNKSLGVFATRSPNRPNPIGLSVVKNEGLCQEGERLFIKISGVDILDGTPVLDIKPYLPYADIVSEAYNTIAVSPPVSIPVCFSDEARVFCHSYKAESKTDIQQLIVEVLKQDPRPQYQKTVSDRVYGMALLNFDVRWVYQLRDGVLHAYVKALCLRV